MADAPKVDKKYFSKLQEVVVAKFLQWKVTAASGSRPCKVGDVYSDEWIGECKTHVSPNHQIDFKRKVWDKICDEASSQFKFPALFVDDGSQDVDNTWVMFKPSVVGGNDIYTVNVKKDFTTSIKFKSDVWKSQLPSNSKVIILPESEKNIGITTLENFKRIALL